MSRLYVYKSEAEKYKPLLCLREIANIREWTQTELAEKLGCRFETVNRWLTGDFFPSKVYLKIIQKFCDEEIKKLLDENIL